MTTLRRACGSISNVGDPENVRCYLVIGTRQRLSLLLGVAAAYSAGSCCVPLASPVPAILPVKISRRTARASGTQSCLNFCTQLLRCEANIADANHPYSPIVVSD